MSQRNRDIELGVAKETEFGVNDSVEQFGAGALTIADWLSESRHWQNFINARTLQ